MIDAPLATEKTKEEEETPNKIPWEEPKVIVLDINETQGGNDALFEDDSGIAS